MTELPKARGGSGVVPPEADISRMTRPPPARTG